MLKKLSTPAPKVQAQKTTRTLWSYVFITCGVVQCLSIIIAFVQSPGIGSFFLALTMYIVAFYIPLTAVSLIHLIGLSIYIAKGKVQNLALYLSVISIFYSIIVLAVVVNIYLMS